MSRARPLLALALAAVCLPAAALARRGAEAELPWTLRVEVVYTGERNREAYLEEILSRVVQSLASARCLRSVVSDGEADLVLRIGIDRLEVSEEKEFVGPATGGPGQFTVRAAEVRLGGRLSVLRKTGETIVPDRKFFRVSTASPTGPLDEPLPRALAAALAEPARWAESTVCRKRAAIAKRMAGE